MMVTQRDIFQILASSFMGNLEASRKLEQLSICSSSIDKDLKGLCCLAYGLSIMNSITQVYRNNDCHLDENDEFLLEALEDAEGNFQKALDYGLYDIQLELLLKRIIGGFRSQNLEIILNGVADIFFVLKHKN